jgi:sugar lactone lactonase YvrE
VRTMQPELVAEVAAELGEGPVWLDPTLLFVDITRRRVHVLDPERATLQTYATEEDVGAAVPGEDGRLILAQRTGFWLLDPLTGSRRQLAPVEDDRPETRMNDGKCDRAGRFWAGTQADDCRPQAGSLYRLELDRSVTKVLDGVTISNGLAWSPDDRLFYFIDTATGGIDVFDYDGASGNITNRRRLLDLPPHSGLPDGMAVDDDGCLWVAMWDGWQIMRVTPDGRVDRKVRFPVSHVTSCAFGGSDGRTLFVTTARRDVGGPFGPDQLADQPLAGAVFALRTEVAGPAPTPCRVDT